VRGPTVRRARRGAVPGCSDELLR